MTMDKSLPAVFDFLIIGQGLAGSLLAWSLLGQNKTACLVSDGKHSASRVAAGLINPVTGQRFVLAELTPVMLEVAEACYRDIERNFGITVFHPQPMARIFNSEKEQQNCNKRLQQADYLPFFSSETLPGTLNQSFSGVTQKRTAWLDTNLLLDSLDDYFKQHGRVVHAEFDTADICLYSEHISWQGISARKLICCQGYQMLENALFSWLPLQPAHGEIISCETRQALEPEIINKSKWLLPLDEHHCRIGATYQPELSTPTVQQESKQQLLSFARSLFREEKEFNCTGHQAGIRPGTRDKQPFIGIHPEYKNISVFNGFGSRGSLMIPYYAEAFAQHLVSGIPIPEEADITRHYSLFNSPQE